jgi:hypothetical protein
LLVLEGEYKAILSAVALGNEFGCLLEDLIAEHPFNHGARREHHFRSLLVCISRLMEGGHNHPIDQLLPIFRDDGFRHPKHGEILYQVNFILILFAAGL